MKTNLTDITVILDRSGSMEVIKDDTIGGLRTFVEEQKKLPGEATFTLVQFDNEYEVVHATTPIRDVGDLELVPRGSTALLDAIGRTVNETGARLGAMPEADRPGKVLVVIITDGLENSSREFTRDKVFEMIKHQREAYQWEFNFLGANQDAIAVGVAMGVASTNAMCFAANTRGVNDAFKATARAAGAYRGGKSAKFLESEREEQKKHGAKA